MDYGGVVVNLLVPDRDEKLEDVVLGYDDFAAYQADQGWYGAITGRYANRIAGGRFTLDGEAYQLAKNNGPNHMHGGAVGFNKRLWTGVPSLANGEPQLELKYTSPDGEEGFPGTLEVTTTYTLTADNGLEIQYQAVTEQTTLCNLTHHGYWNLGGPESDTILDHEVKFFSDAFTPLDATGIPTGEIRTSQGTLFDFT